MPWRGRGAGTTQRTRPWWRSDRTFTNKVRLALESVDVPLLDHVIIGRPGHTSMMALGLMTPTARVITVP